MSLYEEIKELKTLHQSEPQRATGIMASTPPLLLQIAANVMIIAANYPPVAPVVFLKELNIRSLEQGDT